MPEWWTTRAGFENALLEYGSISKAVEALGGIGKTKARKFRKLHGIDLNPKPKTVASVDWGYGPAPLLKPFTSGEVETLVSLSDIHFPYEDRDLVDSALRMVEALQPDNVVLNGDINDFFQLSRFNTGLERIDELQQEIDQANEFRRLVRDAAPNARLIETEGNHDNRIYTYVVQNARALKSLRALERSSLFQYEEHDIQWFPGAGFRIRPQFLIKHGTVVRGEAGASAKAEQSASGISGISGHTHRQAVYRKEGYVVREWWEQGSLCRMDSDYIVGPPNWTNGCVVAQFSTRTDSFLVEPVQARDGKLVYGGCHY